MTPFRYKESFPGSGLTEEGRRITFGPINCNNTPAAIARIERAKADWKNGLKKIHLSCMRKNVAKREYSRIRKICSSIKVEIQELVYYNS